MKCVGRHAGKSKGRRTRRGAQARGGTVAKLSSLGRGLEVFSTCEHSPRLPVKLGMKSIKVFSVAEMTHKVDESLDFSAFTKERVRVNSRRIVRFKVEGIVWYVSSAVLLHSYVEPLTSLKRNDRGASLLQDT